MCGQGFGEYLQKQGIAPEAVGCESLEACNMTDLTTINVSSKMAHRYYLSTRYQHDEGIKTWKNKVRVIYFRLACMAWAFEYVTGFVSPSDHHRHEGQDLSRRRELPAADLPDRPARREAALPLLHRPRLSVGARVPRGGHDSRLERKPPRFRWHA